MTGQEATLPNSFSRRSSPYPKSQIIFGSPVGKSRASWRLVGRGWLATPRCQAVQGCWSFSRPKIVQRGQPNGSCACGTEDSCFLSSVQVSIGVTGDFRFCRSSGLESNRDPMEGGRENLETRIRCPFYPLVRNTRNNFPTKMYRQ
jgi:hypothetical protein